MRKLYIKRRGVTASFFCNQKRPDTNDQISLSKVMPPLLSALKSFHTDIISL